MTIKLVAPIYYRRDIAERRNNKPQQIFNRSCNSITQTAMNFAVTFNKFFNSLQQEARRHTSGSVASSISFFTRVIIGVPISALCTLWWVGLASFGRMKVPPVHCWHSINSALDKHYYTETPVATNGKVFQSSSSSLINEEGGFTGLKWLERCY